MKQLRAMFVWIVLVLGALSLGTVTGCATEIAPPTAAVTVNPATVAVGAVVQLDGSTSADPQGLTLYYRWSFADLPPGSHAALVGADTAKPSFVADVAGKFTVALVVSNGTMTSEKAMAEITAGPCGTNSPVVESVTANPSAPSIGQAVSLGGEVTHADTADPCKLTRVISKAWKLSDVPPGSHATVSDDGIDAPFFVPDLAGDYTVTLVATDDLGRSGSNTLVVTANGCSDNPPVIGSITPSSATPVVGQTVQFTAAVTDADTEAPCGLSESFKYAWTLVGQPPGSDVTLNNDVAEAPSLTPDLEGDYTVSLVVTDLAGHESAPVTQVITAATCGGAAPTALVQELVPELAGPAANVVGPDVGVNHIVQISATASTDPDNAAPCSLSQGLFYSWSFLALPAGSNAKLNDATIVNPSFTTDHPGTYVVGLVVTDSTGKKSDQAVFSIHADPSIGIGVPAGFTITTVATWPDIDGPRGLTKDGAGNVYVVEGSAADIKRVAVDGSVSTLTTGGFLTSPLDIAFEPGSSTLFVTGGGGVIAKVDLAGVQSPCVDNGAASFRGVEVYNGTGGLRVVAADQFGNRARFHDPATCAQVTGNDFGGNLDNPWGVAARVIAGEDNAFVCDSSSDVIRRNIGGSYSDNGGTSVLISNSFLLASPRDIVVTPCPTPKLIVANHDNAGILLVPNAPNSTPSVISTNYGAPVGLYFEDANNLLVTDEARDTVHRITGDFCSL